MNEQDLETEQARANGGEKQVAQVTPAESSAAGEPTASAVPGDTPTTHVLSAVLEQDEAVNQELKCLIEATLLAAGRPVTTQQLLELFEERDRPSEEQLLGALAALGQDYATRGIELMQVASGWRIQVRARYVESVSRLWSERPSKYSRALLETLALVAYRQPITRSEIEEIRGVSISSTIMRTLQERNWIRVVGHREVPGRPELLGTTREFLDYFNLRSLDQLPTLAELKDLESIGVQLELPGNEAAAADAQDGAAESAPEETETAAAETDVTDDPELSADADVDGDAEIDDEDDDAPTLVASADDDRDCSRHITEPPHDDR